MAATLSSWPLKHLGSYKYALYAPLAANLLYSRWSPWGSDGETWSSRNSVVSWCLLHILSLCALRGLVHQLWSSFTNMLFLTRRRRIVSDGADFKQIDAEWHWDDFLIYQALIASANCAIFSSSMGEPQQQLPAWDLRGGFMALLLHVGFSEPLFYWVHKSLHRTAYLYTHYHSIHHASPVPHSFTASIATPLEHLMLSLVMGVPILGAFLMGWGSVSLVYGYVLTFDFMRCMGHCNVEVFPHQLFQAIPFLRYIIYTPTYHSLHHMDKGEGSNYCLFMPVFDALGGTLNSKSWEMQREISSGKKEQVPDFVFLAHVVDVISSLHVPFVFRSFGSTPFSFKLFILPLWPGGFLVMIIMWACSKTFLLSFYNLRGRLHQLWVVPRHGFQYFLPFATKGINDQIELAILRADKIGVKVISLAALNKNEALNGGGTLFVNKHPELRVRVVHGNTLTAAVILNEIPKDVKEVFLTGATSKLGRAIALYLCRKKIRVLMLTLSAERFQKIQKEAVPEFQRYLVQVTKYQAAQNCKTWIVGKWLSPREQWCAPRGTHFHQFVVPPVFSLRKDCTYGKLAAMRLPNDVQGLGMCEYTMERGVVHACHGGGMVHFLEGWTHHEVGSLDVDRIDTVWEAALRQGLRPV